LGLSVLEGQIANSSQRYGEQASEILGLDPYLFAQATPSRQHLKLFPAPSAAERKVIHIDEDTPTK
jgi:hypothetical protein